MTLLGENLTRPAARRRRRGRSEPSQDPDLAARNRRFDEHRTLALSLARRMQRGGVNLEDLEQVACEALLGAIERFDPSYGVPFGAFATATIIGGLKRYYRDSGWAVRVPRRVHELAAPLVRATDELRQQLGREPSEAELAKALGTDVEQVEVVERAMYARRTYSLDAPLPTNDGTPRAAAHRLGQVDGVFSQTEAHIDLVKALRSLPARDRVLLTEYFVHERSQSAIAVDRDVSQMQISRMISGAIARVRAHMQVARGTG